LAPSDHLSRAAERLIASHIDSVGTLDLLLLLHQGRDRDWSREELCERLRCPHGWAADRLERLTSAGLLARVSDDRFRFWRDGQFRSAVDEIARACRRDRAAVTHRIFARPADSQLAT
jgi:hypothetical protein